MSTQGDGKYEKAAKQSQRHVFAAYLGLIALILVAVLFFHGGSDSNSSEQGAPPLHLKKSAIFDADSPHEMIMKKPEISTEDLEKKVVDLDQMVRAIKDRVDIFETNDEALAAAKSLQDATRELLHRRYGLQEPYRVVVELEFQDTISDFNENGSHGSFTIDLAPSSLQPHSIYTFLEVARQWKGGAFHRIAHHVLQVMVKTHTVKHLAFQEYSPEYPHKAGTVGYAGRPSGPAFYVSIQDNSKNHGPGSQQAHNPYEADSCFGTVVEGYEHVLRIRKVEGMGFLGDAKRHVLIKSMTIQVPQGDDYEDWHDEVKV